MGSFSAFCWAQRQPFSKRRFSAVKPAASLCGGLREVSSSNGASVIFHKLYMVRGDFGAIWRVFSAKLALRAAFFSRQDPAASAASNRRSSPAKMIRRRSRIALKLKFTRQFWIIIGKQSATGPESALSKVDPNLQPRWTSGRRRKLLEKVTVKLESSKKFASSQVRKFKFEI